MATMPQLPQPWRERAATDVPVGDNWPICVSLGRIRFTKCIRWAAFCTLLRRNSMTNVGLKRAIVKVRAKPSQPALSAAGRHRTDATDVSTKTPQRVKVVVTGTRY